MRLGEFGAAQRELSGETDDFVFFGQTFTVTGTIPAVLALRLAAAATGMIDDANEGYAVMYLALRYSLTTPETVDATGKKVEADESQFVRFSELAEAKNCDLSDLMRLAFTLFEAQSGRPTRQASDSSPGPSPTSSSSSTSSTHPALAHLRPVDDLVRTG